MKIPFFDYPRLYSDDHSSLSEIFSDVGRRGAFIMQQDLQDFEQSLAEYLGAKHVVGVANATDGLEFCWMAIGMRPGDEVIFASHTMVATAAAIKTAGGVPVPVEIGHDCLIDPDAVEAAISPRTVGIMPTQLNGRTCNMDALMGIASKHGLFMVEDAAQALGSRFKGRYAGTFGDSAAISFFPAKVLGSLGDGGAVVTNNDSIFDKVWQLHDHGRDAFGEVRSWGRNSRRDNLQAAFLNYKLSSYGEVISRRRVIAGCYCDRLSDLQELQLPPEPDSDPDHFDVYQNFELQADRRNELREHLRLKGIGTLIQWGGKAVHQWERLGFNVRLPVTERFFERCLMLPMNIFLTDEEVQYICDEIHAFYRV